MTLYLFIDVETTGLNFEDGNSKPRKKQNAPTRLQII